MNVSLYECVMAWGDAITAYQEALAACTGGVRWRPICAIGTNEGPAPMRGHYIHEYAEPIWDGLN